MNFKIEQEEIGICCDNYNINNNQTYDDSLCIDCDDNCMDNGYLTKFIIDDKIIHQYKNYSKIGCSNRKEIGIFVEKLLNDKIDKKQIK
jgi:hypothetical protein